MLADGGLDMVQTFHRKPAVIKISGYGYDEFHKAINEGRFPKPDAYLGPRSPIWTDETLANWQQATLAAGKPLAAEREARPAYRRGARFAG
jgi:predicted DNA-binding transcriptional regulator AlpA